MAVSSSPVSNLAVPRRAALGRERERRCALSHKIGFPSPRLLTGEGVQATGSSEHP